MNGEEAAAPWMERMAGRERSTSADLVVGYQGGESAEGGGVVARAGEGADGGGCEWVGRMLWGRRGGDGEGRMRWGRRGGD